MAHEAVWDYLGGLSGRKWTPQMVVTWESIFRKTPPDVLLDAARRFAADWDGKPLRPASLFAYVRCHSHRYTHVVCATCAEYVAVGSVVSHVCGDALVALYRQHQVLWQAVGIGRMRGLQIKTPDPSRPLTPQEARTISDGIYVRLQAAGKLAG